MKDMCVKVEKLRMTKDILNAIIDLDRQFYQNFDYSDASWYLKRYSEKNEVSVLNVDGKIVGYFLFLKISKNLLFEICDMRYLGDYYFPESELNVDSDIFYLASVLVKNEFREYSPVLLKALYKEFKSRDTVAVITISSTGKRMAEKFMDCMGNVKENMFVFLKTNNSEFKERLVKHKKN